jgi:hypothetical protein
VTNFFLIPHFKHTVDTNVKGLTFLFRKEIVIAGLVKDFVLEGDEMKSTPGASYRASECARDSTLYGKKWGEEEERCSDDTDSEEDLSALRRTCDSAWDSEICPEECSESEWVSDEEGMYFFEAGSALSSPASGFESCSSLVGANGVDTEFTDREDQTDRLSRTYSQQVKLTKKYSCFCVSFFKLCCICYILASESQP